MNAYYYSFEPTGLECIDKILEAVARAGKGAHHTEDWEDFGYIDKIQEAANEARDKIMNRAH